MPSVSTGPDRSGRRPRDSPPRRALLCNIHACADISGAADASTDKLECVAFQAPDVPSLALRLQRSGC